MKINQNNEVGRTSRAFSTLLPSARQMIEQARHFSARLSAEPLAVRVRPRYESEIKNHPWWDGLKFHLVDVIEPKWNQIKRELITMWQIVNQVRKESPVAV